MNPKLSLRIAAAIMFLHLLGHLIGASTWKNNPEASVKKVVQKMIDTKFEFMGTIQSLAGHHDGYGYASALALFFFCLVLWIISGADARKSLMSSKIALGTSIVLFLWGFIELIYFFPFAAAFTLTSSALCFSSVMLLRREARA